jgi:hypothetical protein
MRKNKIKIETAQTFDTKLTGQEKTVIITARGIRDKNLCQSNKNLKNKNLTNLMIQ